ncbi:MAG TPA: helix-turn-helix domain-containing protein [Gemmataceae bacterium]|jgi:excisionase family DNA binding protein|nr:helix-turn-helix domain-containing protein [Gemmataceae bacterium]
MVQGYYTLEEAARILGMDPEKLGHMAQRREIRAFADRGTWRFRTQDVEELARRSGLGSDPELQLGEAQTAPKAPVDEVFDFSLSPTDSNEAEHQVIIDSPSSSKFTSKPATPVPATSKPGSDSDVHLVFDVTDDLIIAHDSDVKLEDAGPKAGKPSSSSKIGGKKTPSPGRSDSGVRLVPMEEDSGTIPPRQPTPSDSDIRLEPSSGKELAGAGARDTSHTTEEINLDEELRKEAEAAQGKKPSAKTKPQEAVSPGKQQGPLEKAHPDKEPRTSSPAPPKKGKESPVHPGSDEEVALGAMDVTGGSPSGINLSSPADSGINLGKSGDSSEESLEFELSLEKESTSKPAPSAKDDSSGEFELTLEDSGKLAPLEEDKSHESGEKDIFETDFDMPALDEESGSEAVALEEADTDLESSDFDLSLGEEESGSQVVALEDEEADEAAATVARGAQRDDLGLDEDEISDMDVVEDLEEEEGELAPRRAVVAAAPAHWGVLPFAFLAPCGIVLFLLCFMSFELLHGMWGYKQATKPTGVVVKAIAKLFDDKIPD